MDCWIFQGFFFTHNWLSGYFSTIELLNLWFTSRDQWTQDFLSHNRKRKLIEQVFQKGYKGHWTRKIFHKGCQTHKVVKKTPGVAPCPTGLESTLDSFNINRTLKRTLAYKHVVIPSGLHRVKIALCTKNTFVYAILSTISQIIGIIVQKWYFT